MLQRLPEMACGTAAHRLAKLRRLAATPECSSRAGQNVGNSVQPFSCLAALPGCSAWLLNA